MNPLHEELWMDILERLPIKYIMRCKCVCKSWRDLIEDSRFGKSYAPKPCMAMTFDHRDKMGYAVVDEACQPLFRFGLPPPYDQYPTTARHSHRVVVDSVNRLLLLWDGLDVNDDILFVVNPMTCEYIKLPPLATRRCLFGFGVSKLSGQYKVLCVDETRFCHVYTLGAGCWRSIPAAATSQLPNRERVRITVSPELGGAKITIDYAVFFNGNIHWLACDFENNLLVCCFDLETELYTSFSLPPLQNPINAISFYCGYRLCVLDNRLCLCDLEHPRQVVIWKLNKYGDANSWIVEYTFDQFPITRRRGRSKIITPLKVLANGDLLFNSDSNLFIYSKISEGILRHVVLEHYSNYMLPGIIIYTPSFISLKAMRDHNVQSKCLLVRSYFCNS